jgi:hypothetical protein
MLRAALAVLALAAPGTEAWAAGALSGAGAPVAAPTPVYLDNRGDALAVLNSYINAINRKEYARAYGYWESGSSVGSFANFQAGFASTDSVTLSTGTVGSSAGAGQLYYVVPVTLTSLQTNATTQTFVGCYTLHLSQPGIQAAPPFKPMGIMSANLKQVTGGANADTLRSQACSEAGYVGTTPVSIGATPGAPESGAGAYIDNRSGPLEVVQSLFNAINRKEYARAYGYWEPNAAPSSFATFQAGYAQTQSVTWSFGTVTSDAGAGQFYYNVPVTLKAQTTGGPQTFVGCYTLHLSNPGIQGTPFQPLGLRSGSLTPVANDANTGALMQNACTTGVPAPTPTPVPTWTRLSFAAGATSGGASGSLAAGAAREFRVRAGANQIMFVDVTAPNNDVFVEVFGVTGGQALVRLAERRAHWQGTLPSSQDYLVRVVSTGAAASNFALKVTIPRRISFAAGATGATLPGTVAAGTQNTYLVRALAGQTLTATITSSGQPVWVGVYGLGDSKAVAAVTPGITSVSGKLPATQDYLIHAVPSGATAGYTLVVTIK